MSNVIPMARSSRPVAHMPDAQAAQPHVYTVEEVAKILRLSRGLTYAMVRAGQIPAKQIGARWLIPVKTFHEWLNTCDKTEGGAF